MFNRSGNKLYLNGKVFCELADSMSEGQKEFIFICLELFIVEGMELLGDNEKSPFKPVFQYLGNDDANKDIFNLN